MDSIQNSLQQQVPKSVNDFLKVGKALSVIFYLSVAARIIFVLWAIGYFINFVAGSAPYGGLWRDIFIPSFIAVCIVFDLISVLTQFFRKNVSQTLRLTCYVLKAGSIVGVALLGVIFVFMLSELNAGADIRSQYTGSMVLLIIMVILFASPYIVIQIIDFIVLRRIHKSRLINNNQ